MNLFRALAVRELDSPHPDSVIECLPTCASADRPPRYGPAIYRDPVLEFYNANYFHRKGYAARED